MKIAKIAWILPTIFLFGCSTYSTKSERGILDSPSAKEMLNGVSRLSYLLDDNLTLEDFKRLFKEDFIESSKKINPQTSCYEYQVHIYPSLNKPLLIGLDKNNRYLYFIDTNPKSKKRNKIVWIKEFKEDLAKKIEEKRSQNN